MPCTTILVGKNATYDGSTMAARNEDSASGEFTPKKFIVVKPEDQPRTYHSVMSGIEIPLPENPVRYTAVPNALPDEGIWGEAGVNIYNVAMTETETITSNPRVLGADPLVKGGIGEEDFLTIVLPYIRSARDGVLRLGSLLEKYGTYEMNGIGFQDAGEIWWMETIGGHHWIAKRVPDHAYVIVPNQQGIDSLDLTDALGEKEDHLCSADLLEFIRDNHLDLAMHPESYDLAAETAFPVRAAFGSRNDSDHSYNTPRAWAMARYLNPHTYKWDGPDAEYGPESDDIPWSLIPEKKITQNDVKYVLSNHFQGTPYDPYGRHGDSSLQGKYRPIGVNRTNFLSLTQLRPYMPADHMAIQWVTMGSNLYNALVPFYANVETTPDYFSNTGRQVTTESFYWTNRLVGALADAHYAMCGTHVERYQNKVGARSMEMIHRFDQGLMDKIDQATTEGSGFMTQEEICRFLEECNEAFAAMVREELQDLLSKVLYEASMGMKNSYSRSEA